MCVFASVGLQRQLAPPEKTRDVDVRGKELAAAGKNEPLSGFVLGE